MATPHRRRNRDGSISWDATVRRTGHPTARKSFPTKLEANLWIGRIEARMADLLAVVNHYNQTVWVPSHRPPESRSDRILEVVVRHAYYQAR